MASRSGRRAGIIVLFTLVIAVGAPAAFVRFTSAPPNPNLGLDPTRLTPKPSSTSSPTKTPTALASRTPFPSPTASLTPTPTPVLLTACVLPTSLRVRAGPGQEFAAVDGLASNDCVQVDGRSERGDWIRIAPESWTGPGEGWIFTQFVVVEGDPVNLPVAGASS